MRRLILSVLLVPLALPTAAHAGFYPAEVIDGPNGDLVSVSALDIARDGQGGVVYLRRDGGVEHVFFSRFFDGTFQGPARLDGGVAAGATDAVIGASDNNRLAAAWVADGTLFATVKGKDAPGFGAPGVVAQGGVSNPSIDVSINGATYLSWTQNGDIRIARAERDNGAFTVIPTPLDVDVNQPAGDSEATASKVDVSADGTALVVWGERGADTRTHVYARRMFEQRVSAAPQDLTLADLGGVPAQNADSPYVDMEDDSSYAQVVFRQETSQGSRVVMRRLVGTTFDPPIVVDGGVPASRGEVDLTGRGEGLYATSGAVGEVFGGTIFNNKVSGSARLNDANGVPALADPSMGENEDGSVTWMQGNSGADAVVRARYFVGVEFVKLEGDATLSRPDFGPAFPDGGLDADASRAGDVVAVFMQGGPGDRRLVAGYYDKPPTRIAGANSQKIRKATRLAWPASLNLFGGTKYTVFVDDKPIGETAQNNLVPQPQIPDGEHTWKIQITDRRGQTVTSRTRRLRVDNTPPRLSANVSKRGRVVTVKAKGSDPKSALPSGMSRILVDFGDGKLVRVGRRGVSKRYSRGGSYRVRVKALDKAGNQTTSARRVSIGR